MGEVEGVEFGAKDGVLFLAGPDLDAIWSIIERVVRQCPLRPGYALLRANEPATMDKPFDLS